MSRKSKHASSGASPSGSGESITKRASSFLVWMILLLVLLGLGGYGVTNFGGSVRTIGTVGKTEISTREYQRTLRRELRAYEAQVGHPVTLAEATAQVGLDRAVQSRLITTAALDDEAARLGISISDKTLRKDILDVPAFKNPNGKFDREAYKLALQQNGLSEADYEKILRRETSRTLLQGAIVGGITAPRAIADTFVNYVGERRDFSWVRLGQKNLSAPIPKPTDAELTAYYQAHTADFTLPEMKRITYVQLTPDMIQDTIKIDDAQLRKIYQSRISEFKVPERRLVERLVYPTEAEAKAARAKLDAGTASFEDLVAARGLKLSDIDLGKVTFDALGDAAPKVFGLDKPGVVGPLPSSLGPALFRLNAILPAQETSFADARPQLLAEAQLEQARRDISAKISDIEDMLAGGATLEDIAKETDLTLGQIDWWDGLGEGIATYDGFRKAAKKVQKGDFPEVDTLSDGGIFALRLDKNLAPRVQPIDKVMPKVIAGWENQKTEEALQTLAEQLAPQFQMGRDLTTLGLDVTLEKDIKRNDFINGTPPDFLKTVFAMKKGEVKTVKGFGAVILVRLDNILPPAKDDPATARMRVALATQLRQSIAQDVFAAYAGALTAKAGVTLNQAAINAVNAQFP